ncbi:FecR family protein [Bradyrhizobium sp. 2TAF24]|uniref:FecR family protein n=1 Tax=Bradyrhizobium sp. 2TAF24 TaxID=3233011 RepID=UPI003F91EBA8
MAPVMTMNDQQGLSGMTAHGAASADDLRREAKDWVVHLATGEVTTADLQALAAWRGRSAAHAQAYAQACRLWRQLEAPLRAVAPAEAASPMVRRPARAIFGRRAFLGGALAASAAAVVGVAVVKPPLELWPSLDALAADYHTGTGEQRRVAVTDAASIELNTRTSLNIRGADSVELISGEAAVSASTHPVVVRAASGRISASDAQFTVRCDGAQVRVTGLAGEVEVVCAGHRAMVGPGQQIVYAGSNLSQIAAVNPEIAAGWRDGLLIFQDEPLARVIEEVNRYRPGRIVLMNTALGDRRITARFKLARLDAVLTQFREAFGVRVTPLGGGIVVLT